MGIGKSSLTLKQKNLWHAEYAKLKTERQHLKFFSTGWVDAVELTNLKTNQLFWHPMINGFRMGDDKTPIKCLTRDEALIKAIELKKEFKEKLKKKTNESNLYKRKEDAQC